MSHVLPVDLAGSKRTKYAKWATTLVDPPFESLQHFYDWLFDNASNWLNKGLTHYNFEIAFESLMLFYTGDLHREINAEGVTHTREAVLCTWDQQCNNTFEDQHNALEEPEDTADGDKEPAPESMQIDNAVPQPVDKPSAIQAEAASEIIQGHPWPRWRCISVWHKIELQIFISLIAGVQHLAHQVCRLPINAFPE